VGDDRNGTRVGLGDVVGVGAREGVGVGECVVADDGRAAGVEEGGVGAGRTKR
jgi:hypothetical protein